MKFLFHIPVSLSYPDQLIYMAIHSECNFVISLLTRKLHKYSLNIPVDFLLHQMTRFFNLDQLVGV